MGRMKRFFTSGRLPAAALGALLFFTTCESAFLDRIKELTAIPPDYSGKVLTIAGTAGSNGYVNATGLAAKFDTPYGVGSDGTNLYIADRVNNVIRKLVISSGVVSLFAGTPGPSGSGGATRITAQFYAPVDIVVFTDTGYLYVVDCGNHQIRYIGLTADIVGTTVSGTLSFPNGVCRKGMGLYYTDTLHYAIKSWDFVSESTLAGLSGTAGYIDDTGTAARFENPDGIASDGTNLYTVEELNHTVRKITSAGVVTTLAGGGPAASGSADGTGTAARFNGPYSIACDAAAGVLYVSDTQNHTIRKIVIATREVTTFAGSPGVSGSADGMGAAARFNSPRGIAIVGDYLYVCDSGNHTIRKIWK